MNLAEKIDMVNYPKPIIRVQAELYDGRKIPVCEDCRRLIEEWMRENKN